MFENLSAPAARPCTIGRSLAALDAESRGNLERALARPEEVVTTTSILRAVESAGWATTHQTLQKHRRGLCRCPGAAA